MSQSTATAPASTTLVPKSTRPKPTPGKPSWQVVLLPVETIAPSPYQPRLLFDAEEMLELVASVKEHGVQQPILVRTRKPEEKAPANGSKNGHAKNGTLKGVPPYELVAGERRLRACREAGRKHVPAIVRDDLSDLQAAELALLENVQRSNLSVIEEARGYKQLMLRFRMKEERIAKKVGKSVATIQATMKLLALPEAVQQLLAYRKLTAAHGHALLPLASHEQVCTLVAHHAATNAVTAASLSQTLLPNQQELKRKGLLQELDYRTKFDWRQECKACPHKAYVASGYAGFCLKPPEWHKKQEAAIARQKDEAVIASDAARQALSGEVDGEETDTTRLSPGSYRDLTHTQVPNGCSGSCPCRKEVRDPRDATKTVPVCLDLQRLNELKETERKAHEEARRQRYTALWTRAMAVLADECERDDLRKLAVLLVSPLLWVSGRYNGHEGFDALARGVGRELELSLPWDILFESREEATVLSALEEALSGGSESSPDPRRLLLFAAGLLLAEEARGAIRWTSPTPQLSFVLGLDEAHQPKLIAAESPVNPPQGDPHQAGSTETEDSHCQNHCEEWPEEEWPDEDAEPPSEDDFSGD